MPSKADAAIARTIGIDTGNTLHVIGLDEKTRLGRADEINTCIACNQACLDHIFTDRVATCLVNPRAGREIEFDDAPSRKPKRFAVVGGGPAGMAFAVEAARRGHRVTLFEAGSELGGQLNMAKKVPGKNEFNQMLRYFRMALDRAKVAVLLGANVAADDWPIGPRRASSTRSCSRPAWCRANPTLRV